jgi:branched-chain amino acid transport system permease protein
MMGLIWSGIVTGALYALGALGLVLIFKSSKVLNFAFGNQAGLAAFIVYALIDGLQMSWGAAVAISTLASLALAGAICVAIYPITLKSELNAVIASLGCGLVLQGVTVLFFGTSVVSLNLPIGEGTIHVAGVPISIYDGLVVTVAALLIALIYLIVDRTWLGVVFRAVSNSPEASRISGISIVQVHIGSWLGASALGVIGALLIVPTTYLSPVTVPTFMLQAFVAAAIGGFESLIGAVCGGMTVGVLMNLFNYYGSSEYSNTFLAVVVLAILTIFPGGFFSQRGTGRV